MSDITITNPTVPVTPPTAIPEQNLTASGSGSVVVSTPNIVNDGNTVNDVQWAVTNVQNGTCTGVGVETSTTSYVGLSGSYSINPGQSFKLKFYFDVPAGDPGVVNPDCTADLDVSWV